MTSPCPDCGRVLCVKVIKQQRLAYADQRDKTTTEAISMRPKQNLLKEYRKCSWCGYERFVGEWEVKA